MTFSVVRGEILAQNLLKRLPCRPPQKDIRIPRAGKVQAGYKDQVGYAVYHRAADDENEGLT